MFVTFLFYCFNFHYILNFIIFAYSNYHIKKTMIPVLVTIAAFFSIITTAIFKSIKQESKFRILKRSIIVVFSIVIYIICCMFILQQKVY